jgi:hypothetical protein
MPALTLRASCTSGGIHMFAISAILIGVVGIFYVRRRFARKRNA